MVKVLFFLFCLPLPFTAISCTKRQPQEQAPESSVLLGFSQIGAESAWRTYHSAAVKKAAEEAGIQLLFANAEQKQENQIKAIRSFIVYRVDVIAFVPLVQDGWDSVLREAKKAGIPVIICDRKIRTSDPSLYAAYIGTDSEEEGRKAGRFLQQNYADQKQQWRLSPEADSRPLNILEIRGTDGSSASDGRIKGFHEIIDGDKRFRLIKSETGNFMRSRGQEIALELLAAADGALSIGSLPVDILFSANDGMTLGFLDALEERGISGNSLTVISFDGQQEAIDALKAGRISCVVECTPNQGQKIMETAKKLARNEPVPRLLHLEEAVFTRESDFSALGNRGY